MSTQQDANRGISAVVEDAPAGEPQAVRRAGGFARHLLDMPQGEAPELERDDLKLGDRDLA